MDEILLLNIDVSFSATSFALADLAQRKNIQDKVRQEIDVILKGDDPSAHRDLEKKLQYMEMVLKESARMHPALALSLPEKTVKQVTDLGGYLVPKGVNSNVKLIKAGRAGAYHLGKRSEKFGLRSNGMAIFQKIFAEIVDNLQR